MLRRDLLTAEIKKLAEALARILGLKKDGHIDEADLQLQELLETEFSLTYTDLENMDSATFLELLGHSQFTAEKLDVLSQITYSIFNPAERNITNNALALKLQQMYEVLVKEHHIINMVNLDRENVVKKYLNTSS